MSYQNKHDAFNRNVKTLIQKELKRSYYHKTTKTHKKGQLKSCEVVFKTTKLSAAVTYLTRYYNDGLIEFIKNDKPNNKSIQKVREQVLHYIDKFGDRIIDLAKRRQQTLLANLTEHPI